KRKVQNLLIFDNLADSEIPSLDHRHIGLYFNFLRNLANLQGNRQIRVLIDAEFDSGLNESPKTRQRCFDLVRSDRKIRQREIASFVADRLPRYARTCLGCGYFYTRQNRARWVLNNPVDLSRPLRLRRGRGACECGNE